MSVKANQSVRGTTPMGTAKWTSLNTPDTKFKAEGEYRITLLLNGSDADQLKRVIETAIDASLQQARRENPKLKQIRRADAPYKPYLDRDGVATGETAFNFKAKASGKRRDNSTWTFRPPVFDAKGQLLQDVNIWSGSKLKVAYELRPFYTALVGAGVQLKLEAAQIISLVTGGSSGSGPDAFGFSLEEGYDATAAGLAPMGMEADGSDF